MNKQMGIDKSFARHMSNDDNSNNMYSRTLGVGPALGWQLRAEFWATSLPGGDQQLAERVTEALHELHLPPQQLERIQKPVLEAVQSASRRGLATKPVSAVHIRIWAASEYVSGRSWGYFVVERPGCERQGAALGTGCLVELFLYQERGL